MYFTSCILSTQTPRHVGCDKQCVTHCAKLPRKNKVESPRCKFVGSDNLPSPAMASVGNPHLLHLGSSVVNEVRVQPGLGEARG